MNVKIITGFAVFVALLTAACATVPTDEPIATTISAINKNPWDFHQKRVKITGTFDECGSVDPCALYETPADFKGDRDRRISVVMRVDTGNIEPDSTEPKRELVARLLHEAWEDEVRFATVTLEGVYDATYTGVPRPGSPIGEESVICIHCPDLEVTRIWEVHTRRPATAGSYTNTGSLKLQPPSPEDAAALRDAFRLAVSYDEKEWDGYPDFVFTIKIDQTGQLYGGACICLLERCTSNDWPRRQGDTYFDSPANPYKCWDAQKLAGGWKFHLNQ